MNSPCTLDKVRVVLSHPSHPGNIGATARAMKTMGLSSLYLVNPKSFPDKEAEARAAGAWDILNNTRVCASLDQALDGTALAAAITARPRDLSHEVFDARQGALEMLHHARQYPVALVFGTEMSGLTTAEVGKCQVVVHIPANPDYSSLNLASAVQIMAYELRMALSGLESLPPAAGVAAEFNDVESLYSHLERVAIGCDFLDPQEPKRFMRRMRRLFARARLEKEEVKILRGVLSALEKWVQSH
ncbi:MAG: RNA methyltransferase [Nitrosospira sp.]|nr:RNA methyltransferase [Nitrosospira sp.]